MSALEGIIKKCLSLGDFIKKKTLKIALEGLIKLAAVPGDRHLNYLGSTCCLSVAAKYNLSNYQA